MGRSVNTGDGYGDIRDGKVTRNSGHILYKPKGMIWLLVFGIMIGIATFGASIGNALQVRSSNSTQAKRAAISAAENTVDLEHHRLRQEENFACQARYMQQVVEVATHGGDVATVPICQPANLEEIKARIQEAERKLRIVNPDDPLLKEKVE